MRWALLFVVAIAACKKGDLKKCDAGCRNYAQLDFWHGADARIAALPAEKRDEARKKELADFTRGMERGLDLCTSKCVDAANEKDVTCWINAKTYDELQKCKQ